MQSSGRHPSVELSSGRPLNFGLSIGESNRDEEHIVVTHNTRSMPLASRIFEEENAARRETADHAIAGSDVVFTAQIAEKLASRGRVWDMAAPVRGATHEGTL